MAGFSNLRTYSDNFQNGRNHYSSFRKSPAQTSVSGLWFDMSMSPGNPNPQYYASAPLTAQTLTRSTDGGINHGSSLVTDTKHIHRFNVMSNSATALPMSYILCDYLMYYPFLDTGEAGVQTMTNVQTIPRYTDGKGVQIIIVSVAPGVGLQARVQIGYTNQDGVSGRIANIHRFSTATGNGNILTLNTTSNTTSSPFVSLQDGDLGVRSIDTFLVTAVFDVGLVTACLVKPLLTGVIGEQTAPSEIVALPHSHTLPVVKDDAYLNLICCPTGSLSGISFFGELETIW